MLSLVQHFLICPVVGFLCFLDTIEMLFVGRTRILRHMASELNLSMRSDGYVKVDDLLKLNLKTFANIPLRSHTVDDVREVSDCEIPLDCFLKIFKKLQGG